MIDLKITCSHEYLPTKAFPDDAGFDIATPIDLCVSPGCKEVVYTGIRMAIPPGYMALIAPRSGLGTRGFRLSNIVGIIDSQYRGELIINMYNEGEYPIEVEQGKAFAQMLILPVPLVNIQLVASLDQTDRGEGGFGSSG